MSRPLINRARLWLAWRIMPCQKRTAETLAKEIPDHYPEEFSRIGQVCYFIGLTEDSFW